MLTIRTLRAQSTHDRAAVGRVFPESPGYTHLVEGRPPSEEDVDDLFDGKPVDTKIHPRFLDTVIVMERVEP